MKIRVFALDGVFDTGIATVLDTFITANELAAMQPGTPQFDVGVVGLKQQVRTALGMKIQVESVGAAGHIDWLVVPALSTKMPEQLIPALERRDVFAAAAQLRRLHTAGTQMAAACIGTFLLAESGLLDGKEATTTWWLGALFRSRYPRVSLDESRMVVPSGTVVTAGAAMGHLDLALWILGQSSPELAAIVARYLLVDSRPSQAPYVIPSHLAGADPLVARFETWSRQHLATGFSLEDAANALSTSPRTLQRRIEAVLGKSPLSYFQDLRVELAVHLLQTTRFDIERIATKVGYEDGSTLRTLLRRRLGRGVRELRSQART